MSTNNNKHVEIVLANQLGFEKIAVACSASFAQLFGLAQDRIEDLKTVVGEAFSNAMQHGNKGRSDAKVTISLADWNDSLSIIPTGNCGVPASPYYCDQTELYLTNQYHHDYVSRDLVEKSAKHVMTLVGK
jgi:acyl-homoserine lactone acylase PvdQ